MVSTDNGKNWDDNSGAGYPTGADVSLGNGASGLQLTFTGSLPSLGLMLLIDHVFNLTYVVIFVVALSCIVTSKSVDEIEELKSRADAQEDPKERARLESRVRLLDERMHTVNRRTMIALPIAYLVGILTVTVAVRGTYFFEMLGR